MESMRDIKRRISSVENTKKITRAMKMVAAAKLRNAQDKAESARPFFNRTREILEDIVKNTEETEDHPLLKAPDSAKDLALYIVVTGDRGLCGAYNSRVLKQADRSLSKNPGPIIPIGKKGYKHFLRSDQDILTKYVNIDDYPDFWFARSITDDILNPYMEEEINEVRLIYTHFDSPLNQTVYELPLLPVIPPGKRGEMKTVAEENNEGEKIEKDRQVDYLYEPSTQEVLDELLPQYLNNIIFAALLESKASEFGARMTAMDSATENATEMIDDLTLSYNRARQSAITKEINEIVSGAEALK
ncbi:ATP synthase F1 subunit gamma [Halanaerobiaceae bacterium Z-7014]|uniref:ATP synthase gamma chain n=1 Tax=Halonatronomonas betaini TaxID=2778430 RepID=A0A931AVE9_9FIRM|nr:ATP synthase F1 subunit gamma [Halonatronomonas betaini]MBF8437394.1 ATP synthase F1 subunit gamma [Halonatronomonas betaini]